jgi:hypothetical protein
MLCLLVVTSVRGILRCVRITMRQLYCAKTLITNKMHKESFIINLTHSYMFRPCWVIFRENFFVIVTLRLHFIAE